MKIPLLIIGMILEGAAIIILIVFDSLPVGLYQFFPQPWVRYFVFFILFVGTINIITFFHILLRKK